MARKQDYRGKLEGTPDKFAVQDNNGRNAINCLKPPGEGEKGREQTFNYLDYVWWLI